MECAFEEEYDLIKKIFCCLDRCLDDVWVVKVFRSSLKKQGRKTDRQIVQVLAHQDDNSLMI